MAKYYIGIDGGGSKTAFLCLSKDGKVVGSALQKSTYCAQDGIDTVCQRLMLGISQCLPEKTDDVAICFGMPAYGENAELDAKAVAYIRQALSPMQVRFENDVMVAWAGALGMKPGVVLVSGTGSIGYGRDAEGKEARCGGWSEFFSDEGSGYWLGRKVLCGFSKQSDGRLPRGPLYHLVRERFSLREDFDIIAQVNKLYQSSRSQTAALQPILLEAARAGDGYARSCYEQACDELLDIIIGVIHRLNFSDEKPLCVACSGGITKIEDLIMRPLENKLSTRFPQYHIQLQNSECSPCMGAILLAAERFEPRARNTILRN